MSYNPQNPNGQASMANSAPVVVASDQSAVPVSAASLPLPTGASSAAHQTDGTQKSQIVDGSGNVIGSTSNALNVALTGSSTVTANIGTTNGLALDSSVNGLLVTQGSTTSGQSGPIIQTATTTAAPTYTTAKTNPLSTDTSGNLRTSVNNTVTVSGTVTSTPSGTQAINLSQVGGSSVATAATGIAKVGLTDGAGTAITSTASALDVNIKSGGGSSAATADEASWTAGSSVFAPSGGVFNDSAATLTSGQQGTLRVTTNRGLHTNLRNSAGTEVGTASTPLQVSVANTAANGTAIKVDGSAATQPVSGTVTANAGTGTFGVNNTQVGGNAIAAGNGTTNTGTQRVTLSSDSTGQVALAAGTNSVGTVGLNAGANNIGGVEIFDSGGTNKLTVNASGQAAVTPTGGDLTSGSQTTKITDGTNTANIGLGDTSNGFQYTGTGRLTQAFSITSVTTSTALDVGNYRWVSVQITSQGASSTITFQGSNDNSNWVNIPLSSVAGTQTAVVATATTAGLFHGPLPARYFRLSVTGITSGTTAGTVVFSSAVGGMHTMGVSASIAGSLNIASLNGITIALGNGTTSTSTQRVTIASDSTGQVTLAAGAASVGTVGLNAGTNAIGDVNLNPAARGGWSVAYQSALTATVATVSGAAGKFGGYMFINLNSTPAYIQVFDTTGTPTLGSPTFVIPIPANATPANGAGANVEFTNGIAIASGIKIAATTTATGNTTVATGLTGFVLYK